MTYELQMTNDLTELNSLTCVVRLSTYVNCIDIASSGLTDMTIEIGLLLQLLRHFLARIPRCTRSPS